MSVVSDEENVYLVMIMYYIKTVSKFNLPPNHPRKIQPDKNNVLKGIKMPPDMVMTMLRYFDFGMWDQICGLSLVYPFSPPFTLFEFI